jgi:hypothetical protein
MDCQELLCAEIVNQERNALTQLYHPFIASMEHTVYGSHHLAPVAQQAVSVLQLVMNQLPARQASTALLVPVVVLSVQQAKHVHGQLIQMLPLTVHLGHIQPVVKLHALPALLGSTVQIQQLVM